MTANEVQDALKLWLDEGLGIALGLVNEGHAVLPDEFKNLTRVSTFEEEGVLSAEPGLLLRFKDQREFQVTIVRSR